MPTTVVIPPPINIDVDEVDVPSPFASVTTAPFDPPTWTDEGRLSVHFPTVNLTTDQVNAIINLAQQNVAPDSAANVAPSTSPTPTVSALGIGAIRIAWTPVTNASPVMYDVYLSASTPVVVATGNLLTSTAASMTSAKFLPDGVTALVAGTTYYSVIQARSGVEMGPVSGEGSGTPVLVTGPDIAANAVNAEHISANSIDGEKLSADMVLSSNIRTAESGARSEMVGGASGGGFYTYDSAGNPILNTSGGNVTVKGAITATSLDVTDGGTQAGTQTGQRGGTFVMGDKLSAPGTAPSVESFWDEITLAGGAVAGDVQTERRGLVWHLSHWWVASKSAAGVLCLLKFNATGGFVARYDQTNGTTVSPSSLTLLGTKFYVKQVNTALVRIFNDGGTTEPSITLASTNDAMRSGVLGSDGTDLILAWMGTGGALNWQKYTTAGALSGLSVAADYWASTEQPDFVFGGSFDFGAARVVVGKGRTAAEVYTTTGLYQASSTFYATGVGLAWDGSAFASLLATATAVRRHTGELKTEPADPSNPFSIEPAFYVGSTWYDSNITGGSHETVSSPRDLKSFARRAKYKLTAAAPVPPGGGTDDPDGARFYLGRDKPRLKLERQATVSGLLPGAVAQVELSTLTVPIGTADAVNPPPAAGNFPPGTPYIMKSEAADGSAVPLLSAYGDGAFWAKKAFQAGVMNCNIVLPNNDNETFSVVFDVPFDAAPSVVCQIGKAAALTVDPQQFDPLTLETWSTTGFTVKVRRIGGDEGGNIELHWQAMAVTQ